MKLILEIIAKVSFSGMCCYCSIFQRSNTFWPETMQGPSQFPAHNNSVMRVRGVLTGSRAGFTSLSSSRHGRNTKWKAAHCTLKCQKM